ncbi:MAG: phospholipase D-like domain-containing protein [Candidatus Altiarchaeota archaeon]
MEEDVGLLGRVRGLPWTWILIGIMIGVVLGVMVTNTARLNVCPLKNCVNEAEIIPVSDRGYFQQAIEVLEGAQESIHIVTFELKYYPNYPDSSQNRIIEALIDAKKRGVDVRIVVDDYSKENNAFGILEENGVEVRMDPDDVTTHAKLIIVDGETVMIGSTNFSYYGLEKNNEANLIVKSRKAADYYEAYFERLWRG